MVLTIEFEILPLDRVVSPLWKPESQINLAEVSAMDLRYEYFWSRIKFVVNGVDIGSDWGSLPLLDFAGSMKHLVASLDEKGRVTIGFTESADTVVLVKQGGAVQILLGDVEGPLVCQTDELLAASRSFLDSVTNFLSNEFPDIRGNAFFELLRE